MINIIALVIAIPISILFSIWFVNWLCWMYHYIKTGEELN